MKRATITIPDDLAAAVDGYVKAQKTPVPLTAVVRTALRQFLAGDDPPRRGSPRSGAPLRIRPAPRGSGCSDVSQAHDRYLAGK